MSQWDRCSMRAELLNVMGDDNTVVDAARVSFAKQSSMFSEDQNTSLIRYLANHHHWLPFRHPHLMFRCYAPIFVARQAGKHQVGLEWSEISRRYVSSPPEFFSPTVWRKAAPDKKQGSSDECLPNDQAQVYWDIYQEVVSSAEDLYRSLIDDGVAPEQARMVLPQSMYTEWVWTGSLLAFTHFILARTDPGAQQEARDFALLFVPFIEDSFPVSYPALMNSYRP